MDSIIEIIRKIQTVKQEQNKQHTFATSSEIRSEVFMQMETELNILCHDGKVTKGETINNHYYKIV